MLHISAFFQIQSLQVKTKCTVVLEIGSILIIAILKTIVGPHKTVWRCVFLVEIWTSFGNMKIHAYTCIYMYVHRCTYLLGENSGFALENSSWEKIFGQDRNIFTKAAECLCLWMTWIGYRFVFVVYNGALETCFRKDWVSWMWFMLDDKCSKIFK